MSSVPSGSSGLGSLAQASRGKQLNQARGTLIAIGLLTIVVNAAFMGLMRGQVQEELKKEVQKLNAQGQGVDQAKLKEVEDAAVRAGFLINGVAVFLGVLFVVFGLMIKMFPVPITVLSLVLYIGAAAVFGLMDPTTLLRGIIVKVIIVAGLFKAVQAAIAYQKEQSAASTAGPPA